MKLTHGTKVTCEIEGKKITDAKISRNANGDFFICQNKCLSVVTAENKLGYKYSWLIYKGSVGDLEANEVTNLKIVGKHKDISDISSYEVGDILVDEDGDKHKVLGICGLAVILKWCIRNHRYIVDTSELVKLGFNFEEPKEPKDTIIGKELTKTIKGKKYKVVVKEEVEDE